MLVMVGCSAEGGGDSPAPEADEIAQEIAQAIVNVDYENIYHNSTEGHQENLTSEVSTLEGLTVEEIEELTPYSEGAFEEMQENEDYIFGAYYGFLDDNRILYYLEGFSKGTRQEYLFTLGKEDDEWKIINFQTWPGSLVFDLEDDYIQAIIDEEDHTAIFHRGAVYEGGA